MCARFGAVINYTTLPVIIGSDICMGEFLDISVAQSSKAAKRCNTDIYKKVQKKLR